MPAMNRKNLIAIAIAAIVVVALVIIVPGLASNKGDDTGANTAAAGNGQTAPPISPGDTLPPGHPGRRRQQWFDDSDDGHHRRGQGGRRRVQGQAEGPADALGPG